MKRKEYAFLGLFVVTILVTSCSSSLEPSHTSIVDAANAELSKLGYGNFRDNLSIGLIEDIVGLSISWRDRGIKIEVDQLTSIQSGLSSETHNRVADSIIKTIASFYIKDVDKVIQELKGICKIGKDNLDTASDFDTVLREKELLLDDYEVALECRATYDRLNVPLPSYNHVEFSRGILITRR